MSLLWNKIQKTVVERVSVYCAMEDKGKSIIRIKETLPVDEIHVRFAIMGFELRMEWVYGKCEGWSVEFFADTMNGIIAEYFGVGTCIPLQKWIDATEHLMDSFSEEVYRENNNNMTLEILRSRLREKFDTELQKPIKLTFKKRK